MPLLATPPNQSRRPHKARPLNRTPRRRPSHRGTLAAGPDQKPPDANNQDTQKAETNGRDTTDSEFDNTAKQVDFVGKTSVEARLVTEIELTNAAPFKHPVDSIIGDDAGKLKRTDDVIITDDVMSVWGEPDGSHDVAPLDNGLQEFQQKLTTSESGTALQEMPVSNGLSLGEGTVNGLEKREDDIAGDEGPVVMDLNGDLPGDNGGDNMVTAIPDELADSSGVTGDDLVKVEPYENGTARTSSDKDLALKSDVPKRNRGTIRTC